MFIVYDINKILRTLPQKYPFLMVDRVLEHKFDESIVAIKNVTVNEPWAVGHFAGRPVFPGVMTIELMAQVGGLIFFDFISDPLANGMKTGLFVCADKVKLLKQITPGDQVVVHAEKVISIGRNSRIKAKCFVDSELVAQGELSFQLVDN